MAKNYATETDIIETADPLFFPGDVVKSRTEPLHTHVRDFAWDTLNKTWTYCLVHFTQPGYDPKWSGSIANDNVPEKDLKLVSRQAKNKASANVRRPAYTPGQRVYWMPEFNHDLTVRDFQWDSLKQTWTYFLTQEDGSEFNTTAPESEIEPRTKENTRARVIKRLKTQQK